MNNRIYHPYLAHKGKKGMKWGYNDGKKNGKRTAGDEESMIFTKEGDKNHTYYTEEGMDGYGTYNDLSGKHSVKVIKGDSFFSNTETKESHFRSGSTAIDRTTTIKEIGTFEQSITKAKRWIDSLFDTKTTTITGINISSNPSTITTREKGKISQSIDKGKAWISSLFK